jgi:hypothetical protein
VVPEFCPRKTVVSSNTSSSFFIEPSFRFLAPCFIVEEQ